MSYSPSIYYEKLNYFLDLGLRFDEAIVYIDLSDIQDEAVNYSYDEHGVLQWAGKAGGDVGWRQVVDIKQKAWWESAFYFADLLNQVIISRKWAREIEHASLQDFMRPRSCYGREPHALVGPMTHTHPTMARWGGRGHTKSEATNGQALSGFIQTWHRPIGRRLSMASTASLRHRKFAAGENLARLVCWKMQTIFQSFPYVFSLQREGSRFRSKSVRMGRCSLQCSWK